MPKRKKRGTLKKKKDDSPSDVSECDSLERPPSAKKVAPASSTSHPEDEMDQISPFASVTVLNSSRSESGETATLSLSFFCNYCEFVADVKTVLVEHMRQHSIKCPHCSFNNFSRAEVSRHCKFEHKKDLDEVSPEVDSSSTDCETDKDPCSACVFCNFMTYSTEHLEKHTKLKHPGMLAQSVAKMISKQISAEIRRDDALFYLTISNTGPTKSSSGLGYNSFASDRPSGTIVIDPSSDKSEDIKPEVKCTSTLQVKHSTSSEKVHLDGSMRSEKFMVGEKVENKKSVPKIDTSLVMSLAVKVETMYCLCCPYSNVYIEHMKCHTIAKHPEAAAAATYCCSGESLDSHDITFFCVRKNCSFSSTDCPSYQEHLMDCCAYWKTLQDMDKERLRSTITYISKHQKKYKIQAKEGFNDFTYLFLSSQPSLTGISSPVAVEKQEKTEILKNLYSSMATITEASPEHVSVSSGISYKTSGAKVTSVATSSGYQTADNHTQDNVHSFFQLPTTHKTHSSDMIGTHQTQMSYSHDPLNICSTNVPTFDGPLQNSQNYNIQTAEKPAQLSKNDSRQTAEQPEQRGYNYSSQTVERYPLPNQNYSNHRPLQPNQSYGNQIGHRPSQSNQSYCNQTGHRPSQPSQRYGNETSVYQQNQDGYAQPSSVQPLVRGYQDTMQTSPSWSSSVETEAVPIQSEQNFRIASQGNPGVVTAGLVSQSTTVCNPSASVSIPDTFSLVQSQDVNLDLMPPSSHGSYAPIPRHVSLDLGNSSLRNNESNNMIGDYCEASGNNFTNPITSHTFNQQQLPVSNIFSLSNVSTANSEIQPQPMMDLLSDSHPVMRVDEFRPEGQAQELSNLILPQTAPLCPPTHQEPAVSIQSKHFPQSSHGPSTSQQVEEPTYQQSDVDNSVMQNIGNQFSFPPSVQSGQISNVRLNSTPEPGFQPAQSSGSYGALSSTLTPEESSFVPSVPQQSNTVPNFLGAPGAQLLEAVPAQRAVAAPVPFTPPKNYETNNKFTASSPLSPSIYLSGQAPRHRRSNWTDADMRPRGMILPSGQLRGMHAPGPPSHVNHRLLAPGRRGQPSGVPRMPSGRTRMPFNQNDDDDDVIITKTTPPVNRQPPQQPDGRFAGRGISSPVSRGRGQISPVPNRGRGRSPGVRVPYRLPPAIPQPQKQFDISKHFEDLACVVNSSLEEGGNDDVEIVNVTPGKDKDKANQPKAVDASKFSFCCVHCGKDQGSKTVMKQHMKARHNDSLLGAFTNTETGQLLFFCPQLTCEFMTYDEKRLSEHLSKCYDLDKTKPFDFGTAIKNLKSLKIRQLDVRTMGRSQDNPIDLDGQGMKDNFSSSLNDAFGDIVVNASGRHIVRNATMSRPPPSAQVQPQLMQGHSEATHGKVLYRNLAPGNFASRIRLPGHADQGSRMYRPVTSVRPPRQRLDLAANIRPGMPPKMRMGMRIMHPRVPSFVGNSQPRPLHAPRPQFSVHVPVRLPGGGQQDPIVIDLDADSPERPDVEHNMNERPEISQQTPVNTTCNSSLEIQPESFSQHTTQGHENLNTICQGQNSTPTNQDIDFNHSLSTSSQLSLPVNLPSDHQRAFNSDTTTESYSFNLPTYHSNEVIAENISNYSPQDTSVAELHENNVNVSSSNVYLSDSVSSFQESMDITEKAIQDSSTSSSTNLPSEEIESNNTSYSTDSAPGAMDTSFKSSIAGSQSIDHNTNRSGNVPPSLSVSAVPSVNPSIPSTSSHSNTPSTNDSLDEEERVNTVVLEKVFAKVPNMPKNLSRRLVIKFKEYANGKGLKITPDSKVIDEFVSKIYYKGSAADRNASKVQPIPDSSMSQPSENPALVSSTQELSATSGLTDHNTTKVTTVSECESFRKLNEDNSVEAVQEEAAKIKNVKNDKKAVVNETNLDETNTRDVVATHVILAEKNIQFSKTFASLAQRLSSSNQLEKMQDFENVQHHERNKSTEQQSTTSSSFVSDAVSIEPFRRKSIGESTLKRPYPFKRSGSLPLHLSSILSSPEPVQKHEEELTQKLSTAPSSSDSGNIVSRNINQNNSLPSISPEDSGSDEHMTTSETIAMQNFPPADKEFKAEVEVTFPPVPESDISPILITSSVKEVVAKHPALEVDIAGEPLKHELLDEFNKELENGGQKTSKDVQQDKSCNVETLMKPKKKYGLIKGSYSGILDKATGKLLLKKTKRGRPRKLFDDVKEKEDEINDSKDDDVTDTSTEEHAIRRSSRSRKPVNKIYQGDVNELDELMSDDDDEYNIDDDDYDSESDNEWNGGSSEPQRKRIKKTPPPPDPTVFDASTKGRFRCWQCRKVFSKCSFAKTHIIRKHEASGLCVIYMDKSEEIKSPCLLLFCFRNCKYSTLSLDGIKHHIESCSGKPIQDAEKFLEISKEFLESKYKELQSMSLEDILNKTKARKPKDPAKTIKPKKAKVKPDKSTSVPVITPHSEASVIIPHSGVPVLAQVNSTMISPMSPPIKPSTGVSLCSIHKAPLTVASSMPFHNPHHMQQAMGSVFTAELKQPTTPKTHSSHELERPMGLSKTHINQAQKLPHHINSQLTRHFHYSTTAAPAKTSQPYNQLATKPPPFTNQPGQQSFTGSGYTQAGNSLTHLPVRPPVPTTSSSLAEEGDIVYMIEDNGTICLK